MGVVLSQQQLLNIEKQMKADGVFNEEEFYQLTINSRPSLWAETYLNHPDDPEKPLELQDYQKSALDIVQPMKALRWGRGAGKSVSMVGLCFWECMTEKNIQIFYYVPGRSQLERIYSIMENMIRNSPTVKSAMADSSSSKEALGKKDQIEHTINFKNGSRILFFICSSKPEKIRSHHGGKIIIDEAHYIKEPFLQAILGLVTNMNNPSLLQTSTPRGKVGYFYDFCCDDNVWESHIPSSRSRYWSKEKEVMARALAPDNATYIREFEAEWGSEEDSVYQDTDIDRAVINSAREYGRLRKRISKNVYHFMDQEQMTEEFMDQRERLFLGIDWNSPINGVQIVFMVETKDGYLVVPRIDEIKSEEFTQLTAVRLLINLHRQYLPEMICVDMGYGAVQVEMIMEHARETGNTGLLESFRPVDFSESVDLKEDLTTPAIAFKKRKEEQGSKATVRAKGYMISHISNALREDQMILPVWEDTKGGLVQDMRGFMLEYISVKGEPVYSKEGGQHKHMALALAMYGKILYEKGKKRPKISTIGVIDEGTNEISLDRKPLLGQSSRLSSAAISDDDPFILGMSFDGPSRGDRRGRSSRRSLMDV